MIVTRENERLYLNNTGYNQARTLTELAELITQKGGRVKQLKTAIISNRSIDEQIKEKSERLAHLEALEKERPNENPKRTEAITQYKIDLAELYKYNNEPIKVTHTSYIEFVLDNIHYYFQFDNNPFFDFLYSKTKVNDNKISVVCLDVFPKDIFTDAFLWRRVFNSDCFAMATHILNQLLIAEYSHIYRETTRKRVHNTHNNGYHYETITSPAQYKTLDF